MYLTFEKIYYKFFYHKFFLGHRQTTAGYALLDVFNRLDGIFDFTTVKPNGFFTLNELGSLCDSNGNSFFERLKIRPRLFSKGHGERQLNQNCALKPGYVCVDLFAHPFDDEFRSNYLSKTSTFYNNYESTLYATLVDEREIPYKNELHALTHVGYIQDISKFYSVYIPCRYQIFSCIEISFFKKKNKKKNLFFNQIF